MRDVRLHLQVCEDSGVLFVALFLFAKLKARRSKLPCLSQALDLMQSTVSLPLELIELSALSLSRR
jgi:hypothetical protein